VQPHHLTVYFVKKVGIREIRFYVDYEQDESYTPTRIVFRSGTSENNLMQFAVMDLDRPKGWQKVPFDTVGGGPDGNTLYSWVFQMTISDNHQNGKDTHLRGIKIFAPDSDASTGITAAAASTTEKIPTKAPWITESLLEHGPQPFWGPPPFRNPEHDSFGHDTPEFRRMYPEYYEPELMWPPIYGPWPLGGAGRRSTNVRRSVMEDVPIDSLLQSDDDTSALHSTTRTQTGRANVSDTTRNRNPRTEVDDATIEGLLEVIDNLNLPEYLREPELR
jgi:hypothetical protein